MLEVQNKKRIGILRGGTDENYGVSLREGGELISHIFENLSDRYKVADIFVDKAGVWHLGGIQTQPAEIAHKVDLVWNVSSPQLGNTLSHLSIPNINVSSFSSLLRDDSGMLRDHLRELGLNMPKKIVLPVYQPDFDGEASLYAVKKAKDIWRKFPAPWIVKSFTADDTMGVHVAKTFPELVDAILDGVHHGKSVLVEELISGQSASTHSVADFRGDDVYVFPIQNLQREHKEKLEQIVKDLHHHLGVTHYLKSDFTIHPNRGIFVTNVSFSPDLRPDSHFHQACVSVGAKMHHVVEHILENLN